MPFLWISYPLNHMVRCPDKILGRLITILGRIKAKENWRDLIRTDFFLEWIKDSEKYNWKRKKIYWTTNVLLRGNKALSISNVLPKEILLARRCSGSWLGWIHKDKSQNMSPRPRCLPRKDLFCSFIFNLLLKLYISVA